MAQYHRLAVVNISCPLFLELLSFKSFEAECDAWSTDWSPDFTEGSAVIDGDELSPGLPPLFFDDPAGLRSFNLKGGEVFCSWLPVEFTFCLFPVLYSLFAVCI